MGEETDKIVRTSGEALIVKHSPEEEKYRSKYLPDPKKLTDEKLVCTVCSVSLAADIHKGKEIFIHRVLRVLVCEVCYNFYGDGCFSTDEDGDDKYCRWCGQGGTLYLCCACNCAFCQKCVKQNLKSSVLAELENDDWKCYICNPRPLFGCRTICWGAEELNKIGKAKEQERMKKLKEKQEKLEEKKKEENGRRSRKVSTSEGENSTTRKRTRGRNSDSSSPEIMPTKRPKRESRGTSNSRSTNRGRRKKDESSSSDESEDTKRPKKSRKNKHSDSSSEVSFVFKSRSKTKLKKKKGKESLDESSGEDQTKIKHKSVKKKELISDSDNESSDKDHSKNKRLSRKKNDVSTFSENRKQKKSKSNSKKNKETSSDESSGDEKNKKRGKKKEASSDEDSDGRNRKGNKTEASKKGKRKEAIDSDKEQKTRKKEENAEEVIDENTGEAKTNLSSKETSLLTDNAIVKKRINLAVLWLSNSVKDIAELGSLITVRATKFSNKRVNTDYLKTYEDVISTVSKLKQFLSGIHSNYDHIEKNLDTHVKNWKIMTGLEESENEKTVDRDCSTIENIPGSMGTSTVISNESSLVSPTKNSGLKMEVEDTDQAFKLNQEEPAGEMKSQFSRLSAVESENDNVTSNLISSAKETLNKEQTDLKSEKPKNTEIGQSEFKDSFNSSNIKIGDKSSELNSTDLKDPKSDSDGLATEKNLDNKNKKDKEANHLNSSRSPNKEDKNSDNEDNLEESKTTTKKVEEMDSKTELETSENEKTSPLKKHMEGSSKNDVKGSPSKGLGSTGLEEKSGSPG